MTRVVHLPPEQAWTFARLPRLLAEHHIDPWVLTHVGAHHGEEVPIYLQCGFECINLVEPDPDNIAVLKRRHRETGPAVIIEAAATAAPCGPATLHRAQRSVWSGLVPHPTATGQTIQVPTIPINALLAYGTNVLVLDTQGTELELLRGIADLSDLDLIIVETTRRPGDGAAYHPATVAHLRAHGWEVAEEWVHDDSGYTDVCFVKT